MPLIVELRQRLCERSEPVESVDLHPSEPWALSSLGDGTAFIWDWTRQVVVEQFDVSDSPIRCAKFVAEEQWVVAASDDMVIRVFDYTVPEVVHEFDAHDDYIRFLAVHPSLPYLLSCSDDCSVKLWDWSQDWQCIQTFQEHTHHVTMCQWEENQTDMFASCSMDMSIKVWRMDKDCAGAVDAESTLLGHEAGVRCLAFAPSSSGPHIASGGEDLTVRLWDYATQQCLRTLAGHSCIVMALDFHPVQPLLLSGAEDRTVQAWSTVTWQVEETLDRHLDRVSCLVSARGSARPRGGGVTAAAAGAVAAAVVAVGHAAGLYVVELHAEPAVELMLHALREGPDGLEVHYAPEGSGHARLSALPVEPGQRLAGLRAQLAERLEVPERKLKLFLSGGRLLLDADGLTPLERLLSADYAEA